MYVYPSDKADTAPRPSRFDRADHLLRVCLCVRVRIMYICVRIMYISNMLCTYVHKFLMYISICV